MAVIRGKGLGLEVTLGGAEYDESLARLRDRLSSKPGFYAGSSATLLVYDAPISAEQLLEVQKLFTEHGITLGGISGGEHAQELAQAAELPFQHGPDQGEELARRRALRPKTQVQLSDAARSLIADFAGARAEIAQRRREGETSVRRAAAPHTPKVKPARLTPVPATPSPTTLYHVGTLRGGQSLAHPGNLVVVGDVNPGAEIVAAGDIVVFGSLRGVAHAGAQGDRASRVYALELQPTQLRIAEYIAADAGGRKQSMRGPEAACIQNGRIAIFAREKLPQ